MPEHDELAIGRGQPLNYVVDLRSPFTSLAILFRGRLRTFDLKLIRAVRVFGFEALRADRVSAHVIDRGIVRDAIEPGRKFVFGTVTGKRIVDLYKNFLRNVERRFVVTEHS